MAYDLLKSLLPGHHDLLHLIEAKFPVAVGGLRAVVDCDVVVIDYLCLCRCAVPQVLPWCPPWETTAVVAALRLGSVAAVKKLVSNLGGACS